MVEWIRSHVVLLSEALRQIMYVGLSFSFIQWTAEQQSVVLAAMSAILALITAKQTISANKIDSIVDKAMERRDK